MGLNFQTCTIINSNVDLDSKGKVLFEGVKTKMTEVDTNDATKNTKLLTEDYVEYKWLGERSFY